MADETDTAEYDEAATCWHLVVMTQGGKASILKNMDAPAARAAYRRLTYVPDGISFGSAADVKWVEIAGPEGAELFRTAAVRR